MRKALNRCVWVDSTDFEVRIEFNVFDKVLILLQNIESVCPINYFALMVFGPSIELLEG